MAELTYDVLGVGSPGQVVGHGAIKKLYGDECSEPWEVMNDLQ